MRRLFLNKASLGGLQDLRGVTFPAGQTPRFPVIRNVERHVGLKSPPSPQHPCRRQEVYSFQATGKTPLAACRASRNSSCQVDGEGASTMCCSMGNAYVPSSPVGSVSRQRKRGTRFSCTIAGSTNTLDEQPTLLLAYVQIVMGETRGRAFTFAS